MLLPSSLRLFSHLFQSTREICTPHLLSNVISSCIDWPLPTAQNFYPFCRWPEATDLLLIWWSKANCKLWNFCIHLLQHCLGTVPPLSSIWHSDTLTTLVLTYNGLCLIHWQDSDVCLLSSTETQTKSWLVDRCWRKLRSKEFLVWVLQPGQYHTLRTAAMFQVV